jgi:hypothetical protein
MGNLVVDRSDWSSFKQMTKQVTQAVACASPCSSRWTHRVRCSICCLLSSICFWKRPPLFKCWHIVVYWQQGYGCCFLSVTACTYCSEWIQFHDTVPLCRDPLWYRMKHRDNGCCTGGTVYSIMSCNSWKYLNPRHWSWRLSYRGYYVESQKWRWNPDKMYYYKLLTIAVVTGSV